MKTRTFELTKEMYTREEVGDIISEIINEAQWRGFTFYDEVFVNYDSIENSFDDFTVEHDYTMPEIEKVEWW